MSELNFILKEDGKIYLLRDVPDPSKVWNDSFGMPGSYEYALQKAKDNSVLVSNQDEVRKRVRENQQIQSNKHGGGVVGMIQDTIYSLTGYKVEIKKHFEPMGVGVRGLKVIELAVISPIEPEETKGDKPDFERIYITKCAQSTASNVYDKYVIPLQKELAELKELMQIKTDYYENKLENMIVVMDTQHNDHVKENEELREELDRTNGLNNQYKEALKSIFKQDVDLQEFVEATKDFLSKKVK